ncbi:S8 family serine peptidase [Paracoccus albus]|uniref:S8 family serine peptidase n=1 Tax=Paracoccus albus TaxID=3017784 RepID=UPI0022EFF5A3|nr:S8 family serine peptidase [Paracoccus albus]WBU62052.1 S8 family serine peptidase [Paracoccus albus]
MPEFFFWDGYLHWARELEKTLLRPGDAEGLMMEPVFGRIRDPLTQEEAFDFLQRENLITPKGEPRALHRKQEGGIAYRLQKLRGLEFLDGDTHKFDPEEVMTALIHYAVAMSSGGPVEPVLEFFFYRPVAETWAEHEQTLAFADVIDIGAPALVTTIDDPPPEGQNIRLASDQAIGALIDNDIGFLNRRFRETADQTRFSAIWLQSRERLHENTFGPGVHIHVGRVLTGRDIDDLITDTRKSERSIYHEINTDLHTVAAFREPPPIDGHGSSVADLAFGGDRSGDPLLAVQLPPEAAMDTSGTTSESYIVQGFRWLCARARRLSLRSPLVVNISYGTLAGPKDGSKFLEEQIRREILLAEQYGQTVHVVYAFGNSRNRRQVARLCVPPGDTVAAPHWIAPPDNPFPTFMEIRAVKTQDGLSRLAAPPDGLRITLNAPNAAAGLDGTAPPNEALPPLTGGDDTTPCRLYHVPVRTPPDRPVQPGYLMLAIAPTGHLPYATPHDPRAPLASAPSGAWKLQFQNPSDQPLDLVLQIQRGDSAPGFVTGGRQSYFDGTIVAHIQDDVLIRDVTAPLTNHGTNSSYTTAQLGSDPASRRIHTAGADLRFYGAEIRADYSGEGAEWAAIDDPSATAQVDTIALAGLDASGTYSGSRTRLSGTSAAAAILSRRLTESL